MNHRNAESKRTTPVPSRLSEHIDIQIHMVVGLLDSVYRTVLPKSLRYTGDELGSWLNDLVPLANCDETNKPHSSTAEKPDSMVVEVTGNTFTKDVLQSEDDVFVVFYAPWCGYCKRLCKCGSAINRLWSVYGSLRYLRQWDSCELAVLKLFCSQMLESCCTLLRLTPCYVQSPCGKVWRASSMVSRA
jgi:thiol-disulfide isomerase/thioredoxin